MAHDYKVGDRVKITDPDDYRYGQISTVVEVEPPEYDGPFPAGVELPDGYVDWLAEGDMERVTTQDSNALPETRYIEAALVVKNLGITAEEIAAVLDLARKFEEAAK